MEAEELAAPASHGARQGRQEESCDDGCVPAGQMHSLSAVAPTAPHEVSFRYFPRGQINVHGAQLGNPGPKKPFGHGEK